MDGHCHATPVWYEPVESLVSMMDRAGVRHAVLVQIGGYFDNEYQESCLRRYPGRFASVVLVDWQRPDAVAQLEALVARGTVSGLRLRPEARSPGGDPLAIWRAAARLGLSLSISGDLQSFAADEWAVVLAAVPEVPVVMEHLGSVNTPDGEPPPYPLRRKVIDLARFPNAHIKIHGLGEFASRASPATAPFPFVEPIPPFLEWAYDAFGPQRMMWGSDYGLVSGREGYQRAFQLTLERFAARSEADRRRIFGGTAQAVFPVLT
jgi:L-fuconolactonase